MLIDTITNELQAIRTVIEDIIGLPSRWSGRVILIESQEAQILKGKDILAEKQWSCDIVVNIALVTEPVRWRTLIHEMLHSVSVGLTQTDYRQLRGWEEAVVEQLQRLLRAQVLTRIGVDADETLFSQVERFWVYNKYIEATESLRQYLSREELPFYMELLKVPLGARPAYVYSLDDASTYRRLFSLASGKLR